MLQIAKQLTSQCLKDIWAFIVISALDNVTLRMRNKNIYIVNREYFYKTSMQLWPLNRAKKSFHNRSVEKAPRTSYGSNSSCQMKFQYSSFTFRVCFQKKSIYLLLINLRSNILTSVFILNLLENNLIDYTGELDVDNWTFQQGIATMHVARFTKDFFNHTIYHYCSGQPWVPISTQLETSTKYFPPRNFQSLTIIRWLKELKFQILSEWEKIGWPLGGFYAKPNNVILIK